MRISLLLGSGVSGHYELGLLSGLITKDIIVDVIGTEEIERSPLLKNKNVCFYNFFNILESNASIKQKFIYYIKYYLKLMKYAANTNSNLFHIQWFNKFYVFDQTLLNIYYKILGKKLLFTAHNIDAQERNGQSSLLNRLSLRLMYLLMDHIIVHTEKMKSQLINKFDINSAKISVIPHGIINTIVKTNLSSNEAKRILNINIDDKTILFFGNVAPYKGIENLISALDILKRKISSIKLIIAGEVKKKNESYWDSITRKINGYKLSDHLIIRSELIPDEDVEKYFMASDVLILPYKNIFQTGVLFMSYNFGLPIIATDVGSLREDIIENKTGLICKPENPKDLAEKIYVYFFSDLYKHLEENRNYIIQYANDRYSWIKIGVKTYTLYKNLMSNK